MALQLSVTSQSKMLLLLLRSLLPLFLLLSVSLHTAQARTFFRKAPMMCPIEDGNLIKVELFVSTDQECAAMCEMNEMCKFYR